MNSALTYGPALPCSGSRRPPMATSLMHQPMAVPKQPLPISWCMPLAARLISSPCISTLPG